MQNWPSFIRKTQIKHTIPKVLYKWIGFTLFVSCNTNMHFCLGVLSVIFIFLNKWIFNIVNLYITKFRQMFCSYSASTLISNLFIIVCSTKNDKYYKNMNCVWTFGYEVCVQMTYHFINKYNLTIYTFQYIMKNSIYKKKYWRNGCLQNK